MGAVQQRDEESGSPIMSYDDRPTRDEIALDEVGEVIECVWCGALTDADSPCHDQETGDYGSGASQLNK